MFSNNYSFNRENKYRCTCLQKIRSNSKVRCTDDSVVALLPYHWTPNRGGTILANYLNKRREKHFQVVNEAKSSVENFNQEIERKIRELAETLHCHIDNNQCDIDEVIKKYSSLDNTLSAEDRDEALHIIDKFISHIVEEICDFKEKALNLEKERANGLRKLLHDNFQRTVSIGYVTPKDVLKVFDGKIYEVNQQLLSNCSAYHELEIKLRDKANQNRINARSKINELSLTIANNRHSDEYLNNQIDNKQSKSLTSNTIRLSSKKKLRKTEVLIRNLSEEYREAVVHLYKHFTDKLSDVYKHIGDRNYIENFISCKKLVSNQSLDDSVINLFNISLLDINTNSPELTDLVTMVRKSLTSLKNELKNTYLLLHEASHLWDAHMLRVALGQKLTLAAVEELISRHDAMELSNDVTYNVVLEQLATANDVIKLNQCYDVLVALLKQKNDQCDLHRNAEVERLNDFVNLSTPLKNAVLAEFEVFLKKRPIPTYILLSKNNNSHDHLSFHENDSKQILSRDILQREFQEVALCNWRNGFIEKFENSLRFLPEKLEQQISLWVKERSLPLIKRHSLKLMSLEICKERIISIHRMRLTYLLKHEAYLQSHLKATIELLNDLPMESQELVALETPGLYPIYRWIDGIQKGMAELGLEVDIEFKRLKMMSYGARLAMHRRLFEESLEPTIKLSKKVIETQIRFAKVSNFQFLLSLKLLNEGGQLSAAKALEICTLLVNRHNCFDPCLHKALDTLQRRCNEILLEIDNLIHPLQLSVDDVARETAKDVNKKVMQRKKK